MFLKTQYFRETKHTCTRQNLQIVFTFSSHRLQNSFNGFEFITLKKNSKHIENSDIKPKEPRENFNSLNTKDRENL